jgi:hypothetical protein
MIEGYRFISARSLLGLSRLDRCQDLLGSLPLLR